MENVQKLNVDLLDLFSYKYLRRLSVFGKSK